MKALDPNYAPAHLWDYLGGREWRKANWNVSAGLKQLKIAKRKVELKEKKKPKEDVPGAILPREKLEECTVKQLQRWLLCRGAKTTVQKKNVMSLVFYKMPDQGSS